MLFRIFFVFFITVNAFGAETDQELKQKRTQMTQVCRQEMYDGVKAVDKKFEAEKEALMKANLPVKEYKQKFRELETRISDEKTPINDQMMKCFEKIP